MPTDARSVLAIVPARGGSKGLPRKNLQILSGTPLIGHTISAALGAHEVGRVVVSTDDKEIASVSRALGAEVPRLRPQMLAQDETPTIDVVRHVLDELRELEGYVPSIVVTLQPTSPLRRSSDIDAALRLLASAACDSVVSVRPVAEHPEWMFTMAAGQLTPLIPEHERPSRRQSIPARFYPNGAIYATRTEVILRSNSLLGRATLGYVMPPERSVDIDDLHDLVTAQALLEFARQHR